MMMVPVPLMLVTQHPHVSASSSSNQGSQQQLLLLLMQQQQVRTSLQQLQVAGVARLPETSKLQKVSA
jgi:hypothetical protein